MIQRWQRATNVITCLLYVYVFVFDSRIREISVENVFIMRFDAI